MKAQQTIAILIKRRPCLSWTLNIAMVLIGILHSVVLSTEGQPVLLPAWWYGFVLLLVMLCVVRGELQLKANRGNLYESDAMFGLAIAFPVAIVAGLSFVRTCC